MMTNDGFPKNPMTVEVDIPGYTRCLDGATHDFSLSGQVTKRDKHEDGREDIVMLNQFYCSKCLLHVYTEVQRVDVKEAEKQYKMAAMGGMGGMQAGEDDGPLM